MSAQENRVGCGAFDAGTAAAYLEGVLPEPDRELYQSHLHACAACRELADELRSAVAPGASPYGAPPALDEPAPDSPRGRAAAAAVRAWRAMRMQTLVVRAAVAVAAVAAVVAAVALLILATRSQMKLQPAPSGVKYSAPVRSAAPAGRGDAAGMLDLDDEGDDEEFDMLEPSYRPGVSPSYPIAPLSSSPAEPLPAARPAPQPSAGADDEGGPVRAERPAPIPRAARPAPQRAEGPAFRRVGAKTFKLDDDGFLVDTAYRPDGGLAVVEVTAGDAEYNKLLDEIAELGQYFRLADRIVVVHENVVYRVVPRE